MRKVFLGILATVIVLSVCATTAFAAGHRGGRYFADNDGDNICDNAGSTCIYADADGDGICDNCGISHQCSMTGTGCGRNYADADGDGVCDNYVAGQGRGKGQGCGTQGGTGCGARRGHGNGFRCGCGR